MQAAQITRFLVHHLLDGDSHDLSEVLDMVFQIGKVPRRQCILLSIELQVIAYPVHCGLLRAEAPGLRIMAHKRL